MSESKLNFLRRLQTDKNFQNYVLRPMDNFRKEYEQILHEGDSSLEQIRFAQGALKILDWHSRIFEHNEIQLVAAQRKEQANGSGQPRKSKYSRGRVCT